MRGYLSGTSAAFGALQQSAAPNITGSIGGAESHNGVSGAFYNGSNISGLFHRANSGTVARINFDASKSSAVYGRSTDLYPANYSVQFFIKY